MVAEKKVSQSRFKHLILEIRGEAVRQLGFLRSFRFRVSVRVR